MNPNTDIQWSVYIQSLQDACYRRGVKAQLARYIGVTPQRLNHWLHEGKTMPAWALVAIQNYFNPLKQLFDIKR